MSKRTISLFIFFLLLTNASVLSSSIRSVDAIGPVYIRADGLIDPPTAPISTVDNITYTLTGNITRDGDGLIVERDNIVVEGSKFSIESTWTSPFPPPPICGITLDGRSNVTIQNADIRNFYYGIWLQSSSNNSINGNNIANNRDGISLNSSLNNSISRNNITKNSRGGLYLGDYSNGSNVRGNTFIGNGLSVENSYSHIVEDNIVNGRPLVYLESIVDHHVEDAGQVVLVGCDRIGVEDLNLSRSTVGVQLWKTNNSIISLNTIADNYYGIWLQSSSNNSINGNNITDNDVGIMLEFSMNNGIIGNTINNYFGIDLHYSSNNTFCHNNVINYIQVDDLTPSCANFWDNGCEGNYWSNYNGTDDFNDGVGDTYLPWESVDNYPLMNVYWNPCDINHDLKVDMKDIGASARAFSTFPGNPYWNPHTDITGPADAPDGKVDMRDISLIARHFMEQYP